MPRTSSWQWLERKISNPHSTEAAEFLQPLFIFVTLRRFTFQSYNADDFFASLKRCLGLYNHNREAFRALQKRDMEKDFSWDVPAGRYMEQFRNMLSW